MNGTPLFIAQDGEASVVIEKVKQFQEKKSLYRDLKNHGSE